MCLVTENQAFNWGAGLSSWYMCNRPGAFGGSTDFCSKSPKVTNKIWNKQNYCLSLQKIFLITLIDNRQNYLKR